MNVCTHCPTHCPPINRRKPKPVQGRAPVVIGYSTRAERWHVIVNPKNTNFSYQFNCKKGEGVEAAIKHAKVEAFGRGVRWNRVYEERARSLAFDLGLVQQDTPRER